jgi:sulfite reductase (ferredoxin)
VLLDDFEQHANADEAYHEYYQRQGQMYFYELLKPLANTDDVVDTDFIDWGNEEHYVKAIGVGECAGVVIDLVSTLLLEAKEKLTNAEESMQEKRWADAIYQTYTGIINAAKAILTSEGVNTNSYASIVTLFEEHFIQSGKVELNGSFSDIVYQLKTNTPSEEFALKYYADAERVFEAISELRAKEVQA